VRPWICRRWNFARSGRQAKGARVGILELRALNTVYAMRKVTGGCLATHRSIISLMRRAGTVPDRIRRAHYMPEEQAIDLVHMAVSEGEFHRLERESIQIQEFKRWQKYEYYRRNR
jgi:hypothetical protein